MAKKESSQNMAAARFHRHCQVAPERERSLRHAFISWIFRDIATSDDTLALKYRTELLRIEGYRKPGECLAGGSGKGMQHARLSRFVLPVVEERTELSVDCLSS